MQATSQVQRRIGHTEQPDPAQRAELVELVELAELAVPPPAGEVAAPAPASDALVGYQRSEAPSQVAADNATNTAAGPASGAFVKYQRSELASQVSADNETNTAAGLAEIGTGFAQRAASRSEPVASTLVPRHHAEVPIAKTVEHPQTQLGLVLAKRTLPPGTWAWVSLRKGLHAGASVIFFAMQQARSKLGAEGSYVSLTVLIIVSVMLCLVALGVILLLIAQEKQAFGRDKGLLLQPPDQQHSHAYGGRGESPPPHSHQTRGLHHPHQTFSGVGRSDSHASSKHSLVSEGRPPEPPPPSWPGAHGDAYDSPWPMRNGGGGPAKHFCPELVVPQGHAAVLAVPLVDHASFEVRDMDGKPVIIAESAPYQLHRPVIVLHAADPPGKLLAFCRMAGQGAGGQASSRRPAVDIYNAREERFGTISKVLSPTLLPPMWRGQEQPRPAAEPFRPCYILSGGGTSLFLSGSFVDHAVSVIGEQREAIADTEPSPMPFDHHGMYYRLTVASTGDVGLILSALLAIKVMETR